MYDSPAPPPPWYRSPETSGKSAVRLQTGDVVACAGPTILHTLLGSCVATCIFDPVAGVAGMNHILVPGASGDEPAAVASPFTDRVGTGSGSGWMTADPADTLVGYREEWRRGGGSTPTRVAPADRPGSGERATGFRPGRFGIDAITGLIEALARLGANRQRLLAKVFGGGHVIASVDPRFSPGARNVECVLDRLERLGIRVVSRDTGGTWTRTIQFHTDTFDVLVRKVHSGYSATVAAEEERERRLLGQ